MPVRAVVFDIGGVVVGSPLTGIGHYERREKLPHHYLNALITATGKAGAFQRFERGELDYDAFIEAFHREMNDVKLGNQAYKVYCQRRGLEVPTLPTSLSIDGQELWTMMMAEAMRPDPIVVNAVDRIRESGKFKVAALTNNFAPSSRDDTADTAVRDLFEHYIESSVVGKRKPDPAFFQHALDLLGVKGEEVVFLDDIGINLKAARELGISTIRVFPGRSEEAIAELGKRIGLDLSEKR